MRCFNMESKVLEEICKVGFLPTHGLPINNRQIYWKDDLRIMYDYDKDAIIHIYHRPDRHLPDVDGTAVVIDYLGDYH